MEPVARETGAEIGRALAARRSQVAGSCESCGAEMFGSRTRRFCSNACRMRAARARDRRVEMLAAPDADRGHSWSGADVEPAVPLVFGELHYPNAKEKQKQQILELVRELMEA